MPLLIGAMVLSLTGCPDEMEPVGIVETEYEYLTQLRMVHLEAMESSREISGITRRVELRDLAEDLLRTLEGEVERIESRLRELHPDQPMEVTYHPMMRPLEELDPHEADVVFLEDMVAHHQHAIDLSRDLLRPEVQSRPEVEAMAQEIVDEWGEEIQRLQTPLREWRGIVIPEGP